MSNSIFGDLTLDQLRNRARFNTYRGIRVSAELTAEIERREKLACIECDGSGKLTKLGGDWGKTPDTEVVCWRCKGTGQK